MSGANHQLRVLVFGHSFVRRLKDYLELISKPNSADAGAHEAWLNLKFDWAKLTVFYLGIGGLTLPKAGEELHRIAQLNPDVVFIQLGDNDADNSQACPSRIAEQLTQFVASILTAAPNIKHVFWGQLLHRPAPRINPEDYRAHIHAINQLIKEKESRVLHYWPHKGLWRAADRLYCDGVHLNTRGHLLLARSIRGAILRFLALSAVRSAVVVPAASHLPIRSVLLF